MSEVTPAVSAPTPSYSQATVGDFTVESNTETAEQLTENLGGEDATKEAAKTLGKKGGEASAEKRKAEAKTKPTDGADDAGTAVDSGDEDRVAGESEKPLGKPRDDPKARMLQATREAAELKRQLAAEREEKQRIAAERDEARRARETPPEKQQARRQEGDPEPQEADYDDHIKYLKDIGAWSARQEHAKLRQQEAYSAEGRRFFDTVEKVNQGFTARVEKFKEVDPQWVEKVSDDIWALMVPSYEPFLAGEAPTQYNQIADEVLKSPYGPQVLLHFNENPEELQRIASLRTAPDIVREVAMLASQFRAATAGTSPRQTSSTAKPPIRPVMGTPSAAAPDEENEDIDSFLSRKVVRR